MGFAHWSLHSVRADRRNKVLRYRWICVRHGVRKAQDVSCHLSQEVMGRACRLDDFLGDRRGDNAFRGASFQLGCGYQETNIHDDIKSLIEYTHNVIADKLSGGAVLGLYRNLLGVLENALPNLINDYGSITDAAPNENIDDYGIL